MKPSAFFLRLLAIVIVPFAICQTFGPLKDFSHWLSVAADPHSAFVGQSTADVFFEVSRQITIALALMSVPLVLWIIAGMARSEESIRSKNVPPKNPGISN